MTSASTQPPAKKTSRMARGILLVLGLGVGMFLSFQAAVYSAKTNSERTVWGPNEQAIVAANNRFALDLYMRLSDEHPNKFFSPFSISAALTMTLLGARGNTAKQLTDVLHFDATLSPDILHGSFQTVLNELLSKEGHHYLLLLANKIYLQHKYSIADSFREGTRSFYMAETESLDFTTDSEAARQIMNKWVQGVTNDKIQELLQPGVVSDLTKFVIINAIYFKGNWQSQFDPAVTRQQTFYVSDSNKVNVDMMYQKSYFLNGFSEELNAQVLQLPYEGGELSMVIVLPRERTGLLKVSTNLNGDLSGLTKDLRNNSVEVYLPKFSLMQDYNLNEVLESLGIRDMFSDQEADLSGITGAKNLYVSHVVHKAFIDVGEEGSEASAASAVVGVARMAGVQNVFRADHPFLFFIRHEKTGSVIFVGRYSEPNDYNITTNREDL